MLQENIEILVKALPFINKNFILKLQSGKFLLLSL